MSAAAAQSTVMVSALRVERGGREVVHGIDLSGMPAQNPARFHVRGYQQRIDNNVARDRGAQ